MNRTTIALMASVSIFTSCGHDEMTLSASTGELNATLSYTPPKLSDNDHNVEVYDVCSLAINADDVVLAKIMAVSSVVLPNLCDSNDFAHPHVKLNVEVTASTTGGFTIGQNELLMPMYGRPVDFKPGQEILVTARESGVWFGLGYLFVERGISQKTFDGATINIPDTFESIKQNVQSLTTGSIPPFDCPQARFYRSDDNFRDWMYVSGANCSEPKDEGDDAPLISDDDD